MTDLLNKIKFTRLPEYFQKAVGFETYNRLQYFKEYQDLLDFTEADNLEFAARKPKAPKIGTKITQKGGRVITCDPAKTYPCGNVCRGQDKPCKNPIEGQAKTYAEFLKLQPKTNSKTPLGKSDKTMDTGKNKPVKRGETGMKGQLTPLQQEALRLTGSKDKTPMQRLSENLRDDNEFHDHIMENHPDIYEKYFESKNSNKSQGNFAYAIKHTREDIASGLMETLNPSLHKKPNTATTKPEKEVATTAAKETKTEPLSEFESKFPKGMIRNSQTYRDLVNAKKGDVIPVMGMMGEGEIVKINPPSKSRPYGSVSVKPTEKAKEYYKKGNWDVPKQETYDLDLMSDHHTRLRKSGGKPPEKLSSKPDVISPDRLKPTGLNGVGDTFKPTKPPADFEPVKSTENTTFKGDSTKAAIVDKMPEINSPKIAEIAWELEQRKAHQNKLTKPFGNGNPDDPYVVNSSKIFRLEQQLKDTIQEEVNKQIGEGKLKLPYWMPKTDKIPNHKPGKAPEAGITADELEEASKRIKYENGYYIPEGLDSSGNKVGIIGGYIKNRGEALEVAITNGRLTQARRLGLEARDGYVVGFDMPKDWDGSVNGVKRKVKELREQEGTDTPAKETKPRNTNLITDKGEKIPLSPQEIKVLTGRDKLSASDKTILSKNPSIVMLSKRIAETGDDKLMRKWEGRALVPGKGIDSSIAKEMLKDIDDFEAGKGKTATAAKETKPAASTSGVERSLFTGKTALTLDGNYKDPVAPIGKEDTGKIKLTDVKTSQDREDYAKQELAAAKKSGDKKRIADWEAELKKAKIANVKTSQKSQKVSQTSLFNPLAYDDELNKAGLLKGMFSENFTWSKEAIEFYKNYRG